MTFQACSDISDHLDIDLNDWKHLDLDYSISAAFWKDKRLPDDEAFGMY